MAIPFSVSDFCAWQQLPAGSEAPNHLAGIKLSEQPDVSSIPAMLRRRLNTLGRAAASQILTILESGDNPAIVYNSRHGDLTRTLGVLKDLAANDPVSPMNFSLTVHNAVPGIISIHTGITATISSIASGNEGLVPTLLEGIGLLSDDCPKVICLLCDAPPPAIYRNVANQPELAYACCFVLERGNNLQLQQSSPQQPSTQSERAPQAIDFAQFLATEIPTLTVTNNGSKWLIEKK